MKICEKSLTFEQAQPGYEMSSNHSSPSDSLPNEPEFPTRGALLGIDFGTKRLGFAVCNREQSIASPAENYTRSSRDADSRALKRIVEEYALVGIVVGLPVHMSGEEGGMARQVREFGKWAAEVTGLPVRFADERFSSMTAEVYLFEAEMTNKKRKQRLDMLAAQTILQHYLDRPDKTGKPESIR